MVTYLKCHLGETFWQVCTHAFATLYVWLPVLTNQNSLGSIHFDEARDTRWVDFTHCREKLKPIIGNHWSSPLVSAYIWCSWRGSENWCLRLWGCSGCCMYLPSGGCELKSRGGEIFCPLYERERSLKNIHWKRSERNLTCSIYFALRPFRCWW